MNGAKTIGAGILISIGGRWNVTHETVKPTDCFGDRHIIKNVPAAVPVETTVNGPASLGASVTREETGMPLSD